MPRRDIFAYAIECRTPREFDCLLEMFRKIVPYEKLVYGWGKYIEPQISFWGHKDYPEEYLKYYFQNGLLRKDPIFREWVRTGKCQVWEDVYARCKGTSFDSDYDRITRHFHLNQTLAGGEIDAEITSYFAAAMDSYQACQESFAMFERLIPIIGQALRRVHSFPKLKPIELQILNWLSLGYSQKQVSDELNLTEYMVKHYIRQIKSKLRVDSVAQAIRLAAGTGILYDRLVLADSFPKLRQ